MEEADKASLASADCWQTLRYLKTSMSNLSPSLDPNVQAHLFVDSQGSLMNP
jgi:hypothetical protein